ncbi:hypothetical protein L208DRAFT_1542569 [Tricholoma matsutake]|nr:hypothetical protein L208DRAFT_1542569 [Tricholoma matsutake 945]
MANAEILQATTATLQNREGKTMLKWVKNNPQHQGITGANQMANLGAQKNQADEVKLAIEPAYQLKGAKLSELTQSLAYKGIQQKKLQLNLHQRRATIQMIDQIQNEVEDATGKIPSEDQIWKAIQHKDFSRNPCYFLWMAAHSAFQISKYWLKENFHEEIQNRCECPHCGTPERWTIS